MPHEYERIQYSADLSDAQDSSPKEGRTRYMFSNMTTTHLCGSSAAVLCLLLSLYLGGQTYLINQTHDRFSESTILQGSALNTSATSRSLCPSNVYSATTSIQNSTMKIVGPMDCAIPFLPDPLAALTSNRQEEKWVISSGGSFHWGVNEFSAIISQDE